MIPFVLIEENGNEAQKVYQNYRDGDDNKATYMILATMTSKLLKQH